MEKKIHKTRLILVFLVFVILQIILLSRLVYIQVVQSTRLSKFADSQHLISVELKPRRGIIYDRNMYRLAFNLDVNSVSACPKAIADGKKPYIANRLASVLNKDQAFILNRLRRKKGFVWIDRQISDAQSAMIEAMALEGIDLVRESKRFYPNGYLAAHVLGFAGVDDVGLEGLELIYDRYLKGKSGFRVTNRDGKQRFLVPKDKDVLTPVNGFDIILNIDEAIQNIAEKSLHAAYEKYKAKGASIIVMEPHTGEILALANRPTYDLNAFSTAGPHERRNRAVTDVFEPGSVFKVVTASGVLEKGVVDFQDEFFCENGAYRFGSHTLHDHKPHGTLTFREVIEKSSNIGTVKAASKLTHEDFYNHIRRLGFGTSTGIDLLGEVKGITHPPAQWSKITMSALPMGQEIAVTAVQLACAMSAIANGGLLMKPWVVREIRDDRGEVIVRFKPTIVRRVISEETSRKTRHLLQGVVERGTGKRAKLESYTAAGKTGTAQKVEASGRYSHSKFIASFIGFAPVEDPKIVVVVSVDEPRPYYYGGVVSAPVFKEVTEDTLRYLGIAPDIEKSESFEMALHGKVD